LVRQTLTYRWICLGLLFFSALLSFCIRLAPAVVIPNLQSDFAVDAAALGLLTSIYLWPFAILQPVAGVLTDALGPRRTVTLSLLLTAGGQLLLAAAPSFPLALLGRVLTGVGAAALFVGAAKIMVHWFRPREFGTLTGLWTSVANIGGVTAAAPLAALVTLVGWRISFGSLGFVVLGTGLLIYIFVRNSPAERGLPSLAVIDGLPPAPEASQALPFRQGLRVVLYERNTWLLGAYGFLLFGTMTMMQGLWAVPYLMDVYGYHQQEAAAALTLWSVGLIIGCTLWGYVADEVMGTRKGVVVPGAAVYALLWVVLVAYPEGLSPGMVHLALFWGGLFAPTFVPSYAQLKDSVPPQVVATAMGVIGFFVWLGGACFQQVSGVILASFPEVAGHPPVAAYRVVFGICLVSVGMSIVLAALSHERRSVVSFSVDHVEAGKGVRPTIMSRTRRPS
jgi:sugar phosphate permease